MRHAPLAGLVGALLLAAPVRLNACGLTPPIGPNGLPAVCHGDENQPRVRAGLTGGGTSTTIEFGDETADLVQGALAATIDVFLLERLDLSAAFGTALGGHLDYLGTRYDLRPGILGGAGISYRLFGTGGLPFVYPSVTYSIARSATRAPDGSEETFTSRDYRIGLAVGMVLGGVAAPFVVGRYFGAGAEWATGGGHGSDKFRYHAGVGSAFAVSRYVDALAELAFLGEKRATLGVGYSF